MKRVLIENASTVITPEQAMRWYCWRELIDAMGKDKEALDEAVKGTPDNVHDWEWRVFGKFLELTEEDLIIN